MPIVDYKELLRKTNGGLEIIAYYYPEAPHALDKTDRKFKIRDERTASATIRPLMNTDVGEKIYYVTDFGGDAQQRHAIQICMLEENVGFKEACDILGFRHGVSGVNPSAQVVKPKMQVRPMTAEETDASDRFVYKKKPDADLLKRVFGPLVEPSHLKNYNLKQVDHYVLYRKGKAITITATEECPIYAFDEGEWRKIYQPFNTDKGFKFSYSGNKPARHVFGMEALRLRYEKLKKERNRIIEEKGMSEEDRRREWRPDVYIMSGGGDGINMRSMNRYPIWFNSESEILDPAEHKKLKEWCGNIYYVADIDKTGIRQAITTGLKYLYIKLVFIPKEYLGPREKDFKDFIKRNCKLEKKETFEYLWDSIVTSSMPMSFWYYKKNGAYEIAHSQTFQFLRLNGIGKIEDNNLKEGYRFIHVDGNIVREVDEVKIVGKLLDFIKKRRLPIRLQDLFIKSASLNSKQLSNLPYIKLDFNTTGSDFQYFFFRNNVIKVLPNKIETHRHGDGDIYAWEEKVYDFPFKELDPIFKIKRDRNDELDIDILNKDVMFLNFLINTSRMHWKKELEDSFSKDQQEEAAAYRAKHQFDIAGPNLAPEAIQEQKLHLINKIYALGYLFHENKVMNRALAIFAMDNKIESEEGQSNGGSGKSLCFGQQKRFLNRFYAPCRNRKAVEDNQFVYDGVTEKTDYILFDDAHKYFSIDFFFSEITDGMRVNPKHGKPFEIPFVDSPKFVVTSNFAPTLDRSAQRRILLTVFSDYYHSALEDDDEYTSAYSVADDFDGKQMFTDWDDAEYNRYMNFIIQCVQFYLRHPDPVHPPMGNVTKRKLLHEMGDKFYTWAKDFFYKENPGDSHEYLDTIISKKDLHETFLKDVDITGGKYKVSTFKNSMERFCKYMDWEFNPKEYWTDQKNKRIMKNIGGKLQEGFYIKTTDEVLEGSPMSEEEAAMELFVKDLDNAK